MDKEALMELNRKLAEWVGFTSYNPDSEWSMWTLRGAPDSKTLIQKIIGRGCLYRGLNFTHSLDACVEWLVPKLLENKWKVRLSWSGNPPGKPAVHLSCWDAKYTKQTRPQISIVAETPSLALCKAIEKLIKRLSV